MADDVEFEVKINLDQAINNILETQKRLENMLSHTTANVDKLEKTFGKLFEDIREESEKTSRKLEENLTRKIDSFSERLGTFIAQGNLQRFRDEITSNIGDAFAQAIASGGRGMDRFNETLAIMGRSAVGAFRNLAVGLRTALASAGPLIAGFIALQLAIEVLGRLWRINFGGIRTQFTRLMGRLRVLGALLERAFIVNARKIGEVLEPIFKAVFDVLIGIVDGFISLYKATQPVLDIFVRLLRIGIVLWLRAVSTQVDMARRGWEALTKGVGEFIEAVMELPIIGDVISAVSEMLEGLGEILNGIIETILNAISALEEFLGLSGQADTKEQEQQQQRLNAATIETMVAEREKVVRQSVVNENRTISPVINVTTSREITPEGALGFGDVIVNILAEEEKRGVA